MEDNPRKESEPEDIKIIRKSSDILRVTFCCCCCCEVRNLTFDSGEHFSVVQLDSRLDRN